MLYDTIIIGGGPAGLTAGIYLARFKRSVLIIDRGDGGRWNTFEKNENYFGFPEGIHTVKLRELGVEQAKRFGVKFLADDITSISPLTRGGGGVNQFTCHGNFANYESRTIILATGVRDKFPNISQADSYLGKSLFWCITCDGFKAQDKKIVVVGNNDEAACMCMQLMNYTADITFLTNSSENILISDKWINRFKEHNVGFVHSEISELIGEDGYVKTIKLSNSEELPAELIFSQQGQATNSEMVKDLGIEINEAGYVETDSEQRTNVPGFYAAGDITRNFSHQIVTAAHEGSMAAQAANYDLYEEWQRV